MEIEKAIKDNIEIELNKDNIILDSVTYFKEDNNMFLRIVIDKEPLVDIDTCVKATKIINPILDELNIIEDCYILDITSKERGK